jgi:hypothetical protein
VRAAALVVISALGPAVGFAGVALAETLTGSWSSPMGAVKVTQQGDHVVAAAHRNPFCPPPSSGHVLEGDLLDDSLSGQVLVCFTGCDHPATWIPVLLLIAPDAKSLSGTSTLPKGCRASFGAAGSRGVVGGSDDSLVLRRIEAAESAGGDELADAAEPQPVHKDSKRKAPAQGLAPAGQASAPPPPPAPPKIKARESEDAREKALEIARDGAAFQDEGKFEQARKRFLEAVDVDPLYAEGYNGVGVTFFARNDLAEALRWYKKALGVNPSFGDAYYNMACVYALQKRNSLALRYLKTAFHKGYTSRETLRSDPDLTSLHGDPAFEALLGEPQ